MAFEGAADVVGLLANRTVYAVYGDHGGAQKDVQRIPMAFYMPGMRTGTQQGGIPLVDLMPTVLKAVGIARLAWMARPITSRSQAPRRPDRDGLTQTAGGAIARPGLLRACDANGRRRRLSRQAPRPPAPVPTVRPSDESSFMMLSLMASAVSCTAAFSG